MAAPDISDAFVAQYEVMVKEAYQQQGAKLRNTVRLHTDIVGSTDTFQKIAKGVAAQKARNADVPVMNVQHSTATATLADWYAGDYIDRRDLEKVKHDDRQAIANAGGWALGRKWDSLLITALSGVNANMVVAADGAGLTRNKVFAALEKLEGNDVPLDMDVYGIVGPHQWSELLAIPEFADADYVGSDLPWVKNRDQARMWAGVWWMKHTGLSTSSGNRLCYIYHKMAVGVAEGSALRTTWSWENTKDAWFCNINMSTGAVLIDGGSDGGVVQILCDDDAVIA